jgi:thioredoxin-related protein
MKPLFIVLFTLFTQFALAEGFFAENFGDYQEVLAEAKENKKSGVFLFFHMSDCPFCAKMEKTVLTSPEVIEYFNQNFISLEADVESAIEIVDFDGNDIVGIEFAKRYNKVGATPVLAFFDLNGKKVASRTGFATKKEFLLLGKFVKDKAYLKTNFSRYRRANR